ncbi:MAG: monovalent cation/H(+) antiporter subunit G [Anaerolineae bacterium]|nr:monovalent cation/H(+) antiporter subunit G [Anaerolineae bacterium]
MAFHEILAVLALGAGTFFSVVGILGMMRLPDVYCRLHASGKVATLGILGLLVGASLLMPAITPKAIALGLFLLITAPVSTHAIAAAAHRQGVPRVGAVRDDLGMMAEQDV